MILYDDYIWGDKFKDYFKNHSIVLYSNIDSVTRNIPNTSTVIVTHNGDNPVDDTKLNSFGNFSIWFGQNVMTNNNKVYALPIGLENDYIGGQPQRKHKLFNKSTSNKQPSNLVYLNCSTGTYKTDREPAYNYFSTKNWCITKKHGSVSYDDYCEDLLSSFFCVCPRGNGLDCHRNWEVLYLNKYPIMKKYSGLEKVYSELPVVFVDRWEDVTEELLIHKLDEFKKTTFNYEKLKFSYWINFIENKIKEIGN